MSRMLKEYNLLAEKVANEFIKKYLPEEPNDIRWVENAENEVKHTFMISDYYFDVSLALEAITINASEKQLFDYYDYQIECAQEECKVDLGISNYVKQGELDV